MIKFTLLALVIVATVLAQADPPPEQPPKAAANRVARQVPDGGMPMPSPGQMPKQAGDLAMAGLGNIPDPTAWVKKGQEIAAQMASGRRRRRQTNQPQDPQAAEPQSPETASTTVAAPQV